MTGVAIDRNGVSKERKEADARLKDLEEEGSRSTIGLDAMLADGTGHEDGTTHTTATSTRAADVEEEGDVRSERGKIVERV